MSSASSKVPALTARPARARVRAAWVRAARVRAACSITVRAIGAGVITACAVVGCGRRSGDRVAPAASVAGSASAAASAASPASSARAVLQREWKGRYTATVGSVTPPDDAREKTWTKDPKTAALGAGTIELTATGPHGDVTGSAQGALGDIVMSGTFDGSELRASVWPKDPKDPAAMTGWMLLTAASGKPPRTLTGHMRVASPDAKIVREADVSVEPR